MKNNITMKGYVLQCTHMQGVGKKSGKAYDFYTGKFETETGDVIEYSSDVQIAVDRTKLVKVEVRAPEKISIIAITN